MSRQIGGPTYTLEGRVVSGGLFVVMKGADGQYYRVDVDTFDDYAALIKGLRIADSSINIDFLTWLMEAIKKITPLGASGKMIINGKNNRPIGFRHS